jgi:hypothetical protein
MNKKLQHLLSIFTLAFFVFIAFGSDDDEKEKVKQVSATEKIQADENLTPSQKDSLLIIERTKEIENRENQTIPAKNLYYAYQENEVSADNNYKGKTFYVEGVIGDIGKDILDEIYVTLKTGDLIGSIQCYIDNAEVAANLRKGQKITVYGKCDGLMMNVLMKDCEVVKSLSTLKKEAK